MFIGSNNQTSLFQHSNNLIEIRWYDQPGDISYHSWKLTNQEIEDVLSWWTQSGIRIDKKELPIKDYRYKNISISLFTMKTINIRGFDNYGQFKPIGASFPLKLIQDIELIMCCLNKGG